VWEDFIDIFYAPSAVFARRGTGSFWVPLVVVTLAMGVLLYLLSGVLQPVFDAEFDRGMAVAMQRNPRLTPEAVDRFRRMAGIFGQVAGFLFVPLAIVCTGAALWVIGKLFEAKQTFRAALVVAAYSFVPKIVEIVVHGVEGLMLDPEQLNGRFRLSLGIGRFLNPDTTSPLLLAVVGRIDLFTIWVTVLLVIGLSVTGGISRARAFMAAPIIWAAGAIPLILQAARQ